MNRRGLALRYGDVLIHCLRVAGARGRWAEVWDYCDRFERLMANLPPVPRPLVWDGDYA